MPATSPTRPSVDPSWRAYFDELEPENRALFERARAALRAAAGASAAGPARSGRGPGRRSRRDRDQGADPRSPARDHADPRLSRARPPDRQARPAGPDRHDAYHPELDYRTYGFTDADLDREFYLDYVLGLEKATLRQIMEVLRKHLQRHGRHRVHAHPGPRAEGLDPGPHRGHGRAVHHRRPRRSARSSSISPRPRVSSSSCMSSSRAPSASAWTAARAPSRRSRRSSAPPPSLASTRSSSACRIVAGSTCWPTSWASPTPRSCREFQGRPRSTRCWAPATSSTISAPRPIAPCPTAGTIHLSLTANPSHLEAVNPVVMGKVRAKQRQKGDTERTPHPGRS